jgi:hypothetical protein
MNWNEAIYNILFLKVRKKLERQIERKPGINYCAIGPDIKIYAEFSREPWKDSMQYWLKFYLNMSNIIRFQLMKYVLQIL